MSDQSRSQTYEEVGLCSVDKDSEPHQHSQRRLADHTIENTVMASSKLAQTAPMLMTSYSSHQPSQSDVSSTSQALCLTVTSGLCDNISSIDTPAIIIHSAISSPAYENVLHFDRINSQMPDIPVDDLHGNSEKLTDESTDLHLDNAREAREIPRTGADNEYLESLPEDEDERNVVLQNVTSSHSSVLQEIDRTNSQCALSNQSSEYKNVTFAKRTHSQDKIAKTYLDYADRNSESSKKMNCVSQGVCSKVRYHSHDSLIKQTKNQNISESNGKSNSMDEAWCESPATDRLRGDNFSESQITIRQRSGTLDENTLSANVNFTRGCRRSCKAIVLNLTSAKVSKSYNDLSRKSHVVNQDDRCSDQIVCKCSHCHSALLRDYHLLVTPNIRTQHNLSTSHVHRLGADIRDNKHYLLPETRNMQGARGMRSASVDDMRMRSVTDDYVWKDGKVQFKNGLMTHGESVRYVWKDGHVEKITSDANHEDTQVEILETSDNKTCKKINPVFVCIFLIAVIALVIILPIYFTN